MKSAAILLFALMITAHDIFAQPLAKKGHHEMRLELITRTNLLKIDLGASKN
jgi:hypothetical protein